MPRNQVPESGKPARLPPTCDCDNQTIPENTIWGLISHKVSQRRVRPPQANRAAARLEDAIRRFDAESGSQLYLRHPVQANVRPSP